MDIITKRLRLKPIDMTYVNEVFDYFSAEVCTYMGPQPATTINETMTFIASSMENYQRHQEVVYVILKQETSEFLGCLGVHNLPTKTPELGIWLKLSAQGMGYGQESIIAVMDDVKQRHPIDYFIYPVDRRNLPSRRIPEKLGGLIFGRKDTINSAGKRLELLEYHIGHSVTASNHDNRPIIVFDGDSITDASRDRDHLESLGNGHAKRMETFFPDARIFNLGISGHRSADLLNRWNQTLALNPNIIVLLVGINDIWHYYRFQTPLKRNEYYNNVKRIILKTKKEAPNTTLILLEPFAFPIGEFDPNWTHDLEKEQATIKKLAENYQCPFVPTQSALFCMAQSYPMDKILPDGVHPSEFGYQVLSEIIFSEVSQAVRRHYQE